MPYLSIWLARYRDIERCSCVKPLAFWKKVVSKIRWSRVLSLSDSASLPSVDPAVLLVFTVDAGLPFSMVVVVAVRGFASVGPCGTGLRAYWSLEGLRTNRVLSDLSFPTFLVHQGMPPGRNDDPTVTSSPSIPTLGSTVIATPSDGVGGVTSRSIASVATFKTRGGRVVSSVGVVTNRRVEVVMAPCVCPRLVRYY